MGSATMSYSAIFQRMALDHRHALFFVYGTER
jgi:hypothetical protein